MNWLPSLPDKIRKEPFQAVFTGVVLTLAIVLLPYFLFSGLNAFYAVETEKFQKTAQTTEMTKLLGDIAAMSDTQQRFNKVFRELSEIAFTSPAFTVRLQQILRDNPAAFDIFFFDPEGRCFELEFLPKVPKFVAQKFMAAVKNPEKADKDEKWLLQFSGYKKAHLAIANNPQAIVKIGRSDDRQWGGLFRLVNDNGVCVGEFIVFIRKSAVDQDILLQQAIVQANLKHVRHFVFACWDPLKPQQLFPESSGIASAAISLLKKLPHGESIFMLDDRQVQKIVTESGLILLAQARHPVERGLMFYYFDFTLKIALILGLIIILPWQLGFVSYRPGLRAKIVAVLLFGSGSCMLALLFTGFIDRSDRELVLTNQYQHNNLEELKRIDEGLLYEFKRVENLVKSRMARLHQLDDRQFETETGLFWRHLSAFSSRFKELVIVSSSSTRLFLPGFDDPVKPKEDNTAVLYADMILQTYQGRYIAPDYNTTSHNLKDVIHNSSSAFSRNLILKGGDFVYLNLADSQVPTYIDFFHSPENQGRAILMAFLSRSGMQKSYLLEVSRFFDERRGKNQPRLAALPITPSFEWPAFPKRKSAENEVLKEISLKVIAGELPVHQIARISGREYLLSAIKGKYLDGYILILAQPYHVVAGQINRLNRNLLILTVSLLVMVLSVAWAASRLLLGPIAKIGRVLSEISAGNFRLRLEPEKVSEFATVAAGLNRTLESFHEIKVASNIQEHLWPEKGLRGPAWELEGMCRTATELGGDHFDWLELSDGRVLITIGDVTGHGIGAAMVQASIKVWVALKAIGCEDAAELVAEINRLHCRFGAKKLPMSFWAAYYQPSDGRLNYCSAGQSYPIIVDEAGTLKQLKQPGMPLGIREKNRYQSETIELEPGQKLVLYTDGIVETTDASGTMLGFAGLEGMISELKGASSAELITRIFSAAEKWGEQNDDRTIVVLSRFTLEDRYAK